MINRAFHSARYLLSERYRRLIWLQGVRNIRSKDGKGAIRLLKLSIGGNAEGQLNLHWVAKKYRFSFDEGILYRHLIKKHILDNVRVNKVAYCYHATKRDCISCLPSTVSSRLAADGIGIVTGVSSALWRVYCLGHLIKSFYKCCLRFKGIVISSKRTDCFVQPSVVFPDLPCGLFDEKSLRSSYGLDSWLISSKRIDKANAVIGIQNEHPSVLTSKQGVQVRTGPSAGIYISKRRLVKCYQMFFGDIVQMLIGVIKSESAGTSALLAEDLWRLALYSQLENLEDYSFIFLDTYYYRPLWSYLVEQRGSNVEVCFYSINNEGFDAEGNRRHGDYDSYELIWPRINCWNQAHYEFLLGVDSGYRHHLYLDTPFFSRALEGENRIRSNGFKHVVYVFDIQPHRQDLRYLYGIPHQFINPFNCIEFLSDIHKLCQQYKVLMAHKTKRNARHLYDRHYAIYLETIEESFCYCAVDEATSVRAILDANQLSVTFPFSSVPHMASKIQSKNIYYSPSRIFENADPPSYGVDLLLGYDELHEWFEKNFNA